MEDLERVDREVDLLCWAILAAAEFGPEVGKSRYQLQYLDCVAVDSDDGA